jgi:uncharacterized phage protein (TIGR02218 family)
MRYANPPLIELLRSNTRIPFVDCFTLITQYGADISALAAIALGNPTGATYFYTDADTDVTVGNHLYLSNGLMIQGLRYKLVRGLQVDEQTLTIYAPPGLTTLEGIPFLQAIAEGILDGARVERDRAFFDPATWPARPGLPNKAVGSINLFSGRLANVEEVGRTAAMVKVKADISLLSVDTPRNVYQASCLNTLFDDVCKLDINLFRANGTVTGASTPRTVTWANTRPVNYFAQGVLRFTSGANVGQSRPVRSSSTSGLQVIFPFAHSPAIGDSFVVTPGCDHTYDGIQGCPKFKNTRNFRGFPFVPPPDSVI